MVSKDIPHPHTDIPECVSRSPERLDRCAIPTKKAYAYPRTNARAAAQVDGVHVVDPKPMLCPRDRCPAVIGNALVYRNGNHLTATYARSLWPWFDDQLPEVDD